MYTLQKTHTRNSNWILLTQMPLYFFFIRIWEEKCYINKRIEKKMFKDYHWFAKQLKLGFFHQDERLVRELLVRECIREAKWEWAREGFRVFKRSSVNPREESWCIYGIRTCCAVEVRQKIASRGEYKEDNKGRHCAMSSLRQKPSCSRGLRILCAVCVSLRWLCNRASSECI